MALSIAQRLNDIRAQAYARMALLFCSTILGRHRLEAAEIEGKRVLEICIRAGDNYILNWAYWSIAWDYVCRGLTREARVWALKLIDSGRQRQDDRALGMAYWTLAWIDIQDHRFADAIANAQRCRKTAATTFDRNAGMMASATGLLLEGRFEEGLAQLLALKKWALANGWLYSASGVDFAAGPALAATGRIADGIRMLKAGIAACEATGSRAMASWNRMSLAELYLQMLSSKKRPSIRFILSNLGAIVWVLDVWQSPRAATARRGGAERSDPRTQHLTRLDRDRSGQALHPEEAAGLGPAASGQGASCRHRAKLDADAERDRDDRSGVVLVAKPPFGTAASSFETRAGALLRMRSQTLMVRSVATPRVSNHEAPGCAIMIRPSRKMVWPGKMKTGSPRIPCKFIRGRCKPT